jgi:hypothetical protein
MVHSIQTNLCGLFWMRQTHCLLSRQQRHHQMVRAWTMTSQSFHRMYVRFRHQMACVWTMTNQSSRRMSELLHQMVCVWTMSQSCLLMSEYFHHQTMTAHQCFQTIPGYRMQIRMSCFPYGDRRSCSYTMADCSNQRARLGYFGSRLSSCSSRNTDVHQY